MKLKDLVPLLKATVKEWSEDKRIWRRENWVVRVVFSCVTKKGK